MMNVWRFARATGCIAIFAACLIAMPWACGDGGWGSGYPDTLLEAPADTGGGTTSDAATGGDGGDVATDAGEDGDASDPGDAGGVTYECGQGPANKKGIGAPCTKGGNECKSDQNCDVDLDPQGMGMCIMLMCTSDTQCGSRATCCKPDQGGGIKICLINDCLPPECGGPGGDDGGTVGDGATDGGGGSDGGGSTDAGAVSCTPGAGNAGGIGKKCTAGGNECVAGLFCDMDLDPTQAVGMCIKINCADSAECGTGASCCAPTQSGGIKLCIIDDCLPPECRGGPADGGATDASSPDAGSPADTGTPTDAGQTETCVPGAGNEKGVGLVCTKGGKQCATGLSCDVDLDPQGVGMCIKLMCTADADCGTGATCCKPAQSPIKVCIIDTCRPPECGGAAATDGGTPADGGGADAGATDGGTPAACGTATGNSLGVGKTCSKGGKECATPAVCDLDRLWGSLGIPSCVTTNCKSYLDCGAGAICCKKGFLGTPTCVSDACKPSDCAPYGVCAKDADCSNGEKCDTAFSVCRDCVNDADCGPGKACTGYACVVKPQCTKDAECNAGQKCIDSTCHDAGGACGACAKGSVCVQSVCVTGCYADADCVVGQHCTGTGGKIGFCYPCVTDSHCASSPGKLCDPVSNTCVECLVATGCGVLNGVCDPATLTCVECLVDANCLLSTCDPVTHKCI